MQAQPYDWEDSHRQRWQFDKIVRSTPVLTIQAPVAGNLR